MTRKYVIGLTIAIVIYAVPVSWLIIRNISVPRELIDTIILAVLAAATIFYAISTSDIARATREQAKEVKEQRYNDVRPIIDILVQPLETSELTKQAYSTREEILSFEIPCILRNIGVGPAIDLHSFIYDPETKKRQRYEFGTLAKEESTPKMNLALSQNAQNMILVAFYYDVYGNLLVSSRIATVNEKKNIVYGSLSIEPVFLIEESEMP